VFYLDLFATSKGMLGDLKRDSKGVSKKKKKILTGHVGFDPGFTKIYLKAKYSVSKKVRKKLGLKKKKNKKIYFWIKKKDLGKNLDLESIVKFIKFTKKKKIF
jgi:hypothetical protein